MRQFNILLLISFGCLMPHYLAYNLTDAQLEHLDKVIESYRICKRQPGVSIALVRDDSTILTKGYGLRDITRNLSMESYTRTNIGSISKAFTSALLADGVSRGLFTWDTPLRDVISGFGMQGVFRTKFTSLRDALSHKIDIPSYWGVSTACLNVSRAELVRRMRYFPERHSFRLRYLYCNYGYVLAAHAMEVKDGKSWEQLTREKIFNPLGMQNAKVSAELEPGDWDDTAWSHTALDGPISPLSRNPDQYQNPFITEIGPAGGVFASAEDMAKYMKFHLSGGKNEQGIQVINQRALQETYKQTSNGGTPSLASRRTRSRYPVEYVSFTYGMGWRNGMYRGYYMDYHSGAYSSYSCQLNLLPEVKVGVWSCVNAEGPRIALNQYLMDLVLGKQPWLNETTICTYPDPWRRRRPSVDSKTEKEMFEDEQIYDGDNGLTDDEEENEIFQGKRRNVQESPEKLSNDIPNKEIYIGNYEHRAFGTFYIFDNGTLMYKIGRFLNGVLSLTSDKNKLRMTLGYPLHYRLRPVWQRTLTFSGNVSDNGVYKYSIVRIPYLESNPAPVFVRDVVTEPPVGYGNKAVLSVNMILMISIQFSYNFFNL